jgi:hypothetical protein
MHITRAPSPIASITLAQGRKRALVRIDEAGQFLYQNPIFGWMRGAPECGSPLGRLLARSGLEQNVRVSRGVETKANR